MYAILRCFFSVNSVKIIKLETSQVVESVTVINLNNVRTINVRAIKASWCA